MSHTINIRRLKEVKKALEALKDNFVFVGGATVSLYADRMVDEVRPTKDLDLLVERRIFNTFNKNLQSINRKTQLN